MCWKKAAVGNFNITAISAYKTEPLKHSVKCSCSLRGRDKKRYFLSYPLII